MYPLPKAIESSPTIQRFLRSMEKRALANPGVSIYRTVIRDAGGPSLVTRAEYEETALESDYIGTVMAVKEPGKAVYSAFFV